MHGSDVQCWILHVLYFASLRLCYFLLRYCVLVLFYWDNVILGSLTQAIRSFAKGLEGWLRNALSNVPEKLLRAKVLPLHCYFFLIETFVCFSKLFKIFLCSTVFCSWQHWPLSLRHCVATPRWITWPRQRMLSFRILFRYSRCYPTWRGWTSGMCRYKTKRFDHCRGSRVFQSC